MQASFMHVFPPSCNRVYSHARKKCRTVVCVCAYACRCVHGCVHVHACVFACAHKRTHKEARIRSSMAGVMFAGGMVDTIGGVLNMRNMYKYK